MKREDRNDKELLRQVLSHEDDLTEDEISAFKSMLRHLESSEDKGLKRNLTDKQYSWLSDVAKRLDVVEPATNLVSRGLVPRGAEVPTPPILLNRPLKPPGRK